MGFSSRRFLKVFIALSLLSLFADIVYEGARSISGAYLNILAAPAIAAGILSLGELMSYVMRLVGGVVAQKAASGRTYWAIIFLGYASTLVVPLLALAGSWELALTLFFLERLGKGIRAPPRDVIIAEVTEGIGRGKGFGLHELLDQVGAITGPLIVSLVIALRGYPEGYRAAFWIMWIPWILSMSMLMLAARLYPEPRAIAAAKEKTSGSSKTTLNRRFWIFLAGSILTMLGFLHWGVISYYAQDSVKIGLLSAEEIALLYLVAMAVDAAIALPIGALYDRLGVKSIIVAPISAALIAPSLFTTPGRPGFYISAVFWGFTMGIIETIMRAAIADIVPAEARSMAYGIYSFGIGLGWAASGMLLAYLYQVEAIMGIIAFCAIMEAAAAIIFMAIPRAVGKL
jgi:MFS family permease